MLRDEINVVENIRLRYLLTIPLNYQLKSDLDLLKQLAFRYKVYSS